MTEIILSNPNLENTINFAIIIFMGMPLNCIKMFIFIFVQRFLKKVNLMMPPFKIIILIFPVIQSRKTEVLRRLKDVP